jgi:serine-type D-Ala-D-Ala carboxypeptidase/endopeptidase (penicillin-binding protein 4)
MRQLYFKKLSLKIGCEIMQENKNSRIIVKKERTVLSARAAACGFLPAVCVAFALIAPRPAASDSASAPGAIRPPSPVVMAGLQKPVEALLAKGKYPLSKVAIALRDIASDTMCAALNADTLFNPASVSKLVTAAMAFDKLGTGYTFKTLVFLDSVFDPATGACRGNMYIRGGGDPSLVIERMWLFVQYLAAMGIKRVEKDIVLDDSFFDTASCGPGFYEDSADNPYMAPVNALSANFNCVSVWARPGIAAGAPVFTGMLPKADIVNLSSTAKTGAAGKQNDFAITVRKSPNADATMVTVSGTMPQDNKQVLEYRKVWQARDYFASILQGLLSDNKIVFKGGFRHGVVPDSLKRKPPFLVFPSIPLYDIVTDMFKYSSNFAAEMIFKTLSAEKDSTFGSWEKSSALAQAWWREKGLPCSPKIKNGSGMGDSNRLSCRQIVELLSLVNRSKSFYPEYLYALPSAGVDGTLKSRFKTSRFKGIVRAKTGTLNDFAVHSIAGYVLLPKKTYAFAIIFNGISSRTQSNQWEMQEKILDLIIPER